MPRCVPEQARPTKEATTTALAQTTHARVASAVAAVTTVAAARPVEILPAAIAPLPARALGELRSGERAVVCGLSDACDASVRRRLNQLGFVEGREVEIVRRAPLGSPVVVRVCDAQICLRRAQTDLISVTGHDAPAA